MLGGRHHIATRSNLIVLLADELAYPMESLLSYCLNAKVNPREELGPSVHIPHIQSTMLQFPCCQGYKVHDVSINWAKIPAAMCPDLFVRFSSNKKCKNWHWGAEVTVGRTGRLQGHTKKKTCHSKKRRQMFLPPESETSVTKMVGCSRLCRNILAHSLVEVEVHNSRLMNHDNPTLMEKVERMVRTTYMCGTLF